jgi:hypothetical protein
MDVKPNVHLILCENGCKTKCPPYPLGEWMKNKMSTLSFRRMDEKSNVHLIL